MFNKELSFFIQNQSKLVQQYQGKYLMLQEEEVVGVYDNPREAYFEGEKKFGLGSFMIQHCVPGVDAYTVSISSANVLG